MASDPKKKDATESPHKKVQAEALDRLAECRAQKAVWTPAIQEAYFFAAPERSRQITSSVAANKLPPQDVAELQTSLAIEQSEDFATTIINAFMPPLQDWVKLSPSSMVPDEFQGEVQEKAKAQCQATFKMIRESNFYEELALILNPDAAVGTFALMIEEPKQFHQPVKVLAVPLREIEVNIGPDGSLDTRFVVRHTKYRYVKALIGKEIKLPKPILEKIEKTPKQNARVSWGFWRKWEEENDVCWQRVIMVDDVVVFEETLKGDGSLPLIVVRFNPLPEYPFGCGPLIKAAPDLRVIDEMSAGMVDNVDLSLRPPMTYPDDSFVNVENGIEAGAWYPIRPGTEGAVKKMYEPNRLDASYFDMAQREKRVKRMFYNDFPEQRGDTPPTATQWIDEMAMAQRRIGTPGTKFWAEGPCQIFKRFWFIARKRNKVKDTKVGNRTISLAPENPTSAARDQQEVANAVRGLQVGMSLFPEETKTSVDGTSTMKNIIAKLGASDIVSWRSKDQLMAATKMISQLSGAAPANTELQPGQIGAPPA